MIGRLLGTLFVLAVLPLAIALYVLRPLVLLAAQVICIPVYCVLWLIRLK